MEQTCCFGKHKGKKFAEIINEDIDYCRWLVKQSVLINDEARQALAEKLKDKPVDDDNNDKMRWGKYKNRENIEWIYKNDQSYFRWLAGNAYVNKNCPALAKKIDELISKGG